MQQQTYNHDRDHVESMFNDIAGHYDFLNHFLSLNIDTRWRRKAVRWLVSSHPLTTPPSLKPPQDVLDVATGTGDLAIAISRKVTGRIIGVDISEGMLKLGREKIAKKGLTKRIILQKGDSEHLDFPAGQFDAVTVGFGVRNFENLSQGLYEIHRVLKSGGKIVILEFSKPSNGLVRGVFNLYFLKILPWIGTLFSKKEAYHYLPNSVQQFPCGKAFCSRLSEVGFTHIMYKPLSLGIATLYMGRKS